MAFTTWAALRTSIKDAIADSIAGSPCTGSFALPNGRTMTYRSYDELINLLSKTYTLESLETPGSPSTRVSYGRPRRFGR